METKVDQTLDCKGLSCPMPMMKLAKAVKGLKSGEVLEMLGTDPGTKSDLPRWCNKTGNTLLDESELPGGISRFLIQKK
ncbi:MAG: sulfurtransferase TusA family protein [Bacteroidetes bacterium]|nr:sulfurtransferase TusA family protein [Bacteroidota bacterium]MBL7105516.1 sulfurtransferase TusA family protein [Bacteroidales bacterium]